MNANETTGLGSPDPLDWITIWQSELAALATDRECHEALVAAAQSWASLTDGSATRDDGPAGRAGPDAPPRPEAAGPASGAGDDEVARLRRRIAELEHAAAAAGGGG